MLCTKTGSAREFSLIFADNFISFASIRVHSRAKSKNPFHEPSFCAEPIRNRSLSTEDN
jgi:hypothetical protein